MALRAPPPPGIPATKIRGASSGAPALYHSREPPPGLNERCFDLNYVLAGREMLAFPEIDSIYSLSDPVTSLAAALFHEAFHRYQATHFQPTNGPERFVALEEPPPVPKEIVFSPEFQNLASEERALLAQALGSLEAESLRAALRAYLQVRQRRMELIPKTDRSTEAHNERKEGSAHLVSYQMALSAAGVPAGEVTDLVSRDLLATPSFDENPRMTSYRHWHIYATGAAIGLLLDRLGADWRAEMEAGATFVDLARAVVLECRPAEGEANTGQRFHCA